MIIVFRKNGNQLIPLGKSSRPKALATGQELANIIMSRSCANSVVTLLELQGQKLVSKNLNKNSDCKLTYILLISVVFMRTLKLINSIDLQFNPVHLALTPSSTHGTVQPSRWCSKRNSNPETVILPHIQFTPSEIHRHFRCTTHQIRV